MMGVRKVLQWLLGDLVPRAALVLVVFVPPMLSRRANAERPGRRGRRRRRKGAQPDGAQPGDGRRRPVPSVSLMDLTRSISGISERPLGGAVRLAGDLFASLLAESAMRSPLLPLALWTALAACAAPGAACEDDPEPDPLKGLSGEWRLASTADEHRTTPGNPLLRMVVGKGGEVRFLLGDRQNNSGTFAAAKPRGKPRAIDLKLRGGGMLRGVYGFDGGELVLCFAEEGKARPTSLKPGGTQWAECWRRADRE
jgi:uncharacterized protein (TIGR03067 family)